MKTRENVVVIGGSFAGRRVERLLRHDFTVTLIDAKGFWEYHPAAARALVEPSSASRIVQPQPKRMTIATVESIEPPKDGRAVQGRDHASTMRLSTGECLEFDYCVICTGSAYVAPIKSDQTTAITAEDRRKQYADANLELSAAKSVVVVGGGFVGVELAAEIAGRWGSKKKVTLLTSHPTLLERMHKDVGVAAEKWLVSKGVHLVFNQRVDAAKSSSHEVVTESGLSIKADLVYSCMGFKPNALPLRQHYPGALTEHGGVKVNEFLQVEGLHNVFAVGDCTATLEEKNALAADLGASLAVINIRALASKRDMALFPQGVCHGRSTVPTIACVSLYKWSGVMQFNGLVLSGFVPALVKALIEYLQLSTASECAIQTGAWDIIERVNIFLGRYLFVPRNLELE